jgi:serine/threonine protein kinase
MGEVYRARDTELERDVAVKVLPEAVSQNPDRLARFKKETKAVAGLSHPNILDIHDYGREGDITYSVTELLQGETLTERLEGGALGWRKSTEIGAAIADGLGAAHEAGIVHRDLKPSNVFLTADGRVKVLDFGLARHEDVEKGKDETAVPTMTRQTDPGGVRSAGVRAGHRGRDHDRDSQGGAHGHLRLWRGPATRASRNRQTLPRETAAIPVPIGP